jgi:hypothetical protein
VVVVVFNRLRDSGQKEEEGDEWMEWMEWKIWRALTTHSKAATPKGKFRRRVCGDLIQVLH